MIGGHADETSASSGDACSEHGKERDGTQRAVAIVLMGLALKVVPFGMGMPSKTAAGQWMLNDFRRLMQPADVQKTANYHRTKQLEPLMPMLAPVMPIFARVPAGLAGYKRLDTTMQGSVYDYASVDSLPDVTYLTPFVVIPGVLMLLAGWGLWHEHEVSVHITHPTPA